MIQLRAIVIYSHDGRHRVVPLEPGRVNIISGDSRTGKSAILGIIDYFFGASECDVPEGKVRRNVSWFGLCMQTRRGQAFVARQLPLGEGRSNEAVYIRTGDVVDIPAASELRQTTNRDGLRALLASWVGLSEYVHEPPEGQTRAPLVATISHAITYCFQSQNEIAQRRHLFHGSSDRFVALAIRDTLPYFLGAVSDDYLANQQELKRVRTEIRHVERRLAEAAAIRGDGVSRADTLLAEAKASGLTILEDNASWQEKVEALRQIQNSPVPTTLIEADQDGEFRRLTALRSALVDEQRALQATLDRAKGFEGSSKGFSAEAREHHARLNAVTVFNDEAPEHTCPLCLQNLAESAQVPTISDLRTAQDYIAERSGTVDSATPRIESAVQEVETKLAEVRRRLNENRELLTAVKKSSERLQLAADTDARRAMVLGRISLYVENIPDMPDVRDQCVRLEELKAQAVLLDQAVSSDVAQAKLESCLSNVNRYLSNYARQIDLEYSESPLRLDPRALTIVADTTERPVPMPEIGSGENHVGYHIVAHLALHTWFARRDRPVPAFLLLDQLSQAHFSPDAASREGVTSERFDADRRAVKRLYGLVFDVVESLEGRFQVIITDHPDFSDDTRFQEALRERWRGGRKLVPDDWPRAGA
jgi:predicted  nucleic acid-binding Zn-ribbon protein